MIATPAETGVTPGDRRVERTSVKRRLTPEQARSFVDRWRLVNEAEIAELRATPIEDRFRQLAVLIASVEELGWAQALEAETEITRERWQRLRRAYGG